jgi:hypothetical protein
MRRVGIERETFRIEMVFNNCVFHAGSDESMKSRMACRFRSQRLRNDSGEPARRDGLIATVAALLLQASAVCAGTLPHAPQVGDIYQITLIKDSEQRGNNGSSGSTHDKDSIIEHVMGLQAGGLELKHDLPNGATTEERARNWQFPAEIFKPRGGPAQLLNGPELEARVDSWLKTASLSREACGHWIFTWNAFRIECDAQSVLKIVQSYDLRSVDLHEGAVYRDSEASSPGKLARKAGGSDGETFIADMPIDSEMVRRARAESDVVLGEIIKKPVSLEAALHEHEAEILSGTISVVFDTDLDGNVRRRTKVTKLNIKRADGRTETQSVTETLERRIISRRD